MKNIAFLFLLILFCQPLFAQSKYKKNIYAINQCVLGYSADNGTPLVLYETTGTLEQKSNNVIQRIKLSEIALIEVQTNRSGFSLNVNCGEGGKCINLIKSDMSSSPLSGTAFLFTDAAAANTCAEEIGTLVTAYRAGKEGLSVKLFVKADGTTPRLKINPSETFTEELPLKKETVDLEEDEEEIPEPVVSKPARKEKAAEPDEEEDPIRARKAAAANSKEDREEAREQAKEAREAAAEARKEKIAKQQEARTRKTKESEDDEDAEPATRRKAAEPQRDEPAADNRIGNDVCDQMMAILQSGKTNGFKDIEGKLTNPDSKINESTIKLRGAKRNYLSWYKNQRAFIAEFKTMADRELLVSEFEKLQSNLDDCLGSGWDDEDHSGDEIYASSEDEAKDIEYKNSLDPNAPTVRIMIVNDQKKYTLFVRIR
ncbi:MAG: hypothetical protein JNJ58_00035 [Chitinophagaceae bacterium]|nr:hypothetical protein [Chitinophagaceae bacterium]